MSCFVFRTSDDDKNWLHQELLSGRLRQGWGIPGSKLKDSNGPINFQSWFSNYRTGAKNNWNEEITEDSARKRYRILSPLLEIAKDDIIIVPKMPDWSTFCVCLAAGDYFFDDMQSTERNGYEDFRHVIPIDLSSMRFFNYASSPQSKIIRTKFRAYQSAINRVWNKEFIDSAVHLLSKESDSKCRTEIDLLSDIKPELYRKYLEHVISLGHREVENIVEHAFNSAGYKTILRNHFDGKGGDVDIVVEKELPLLSDTIDIQNRIYIQVKTKKELDSNDTAGIDQLLTITQNDEKAIRVLISTADSFTEKCKIRARENDVHLISGIHLIGLIVKYL